MDYEQRKKFTKITAEFTGALIFWAKQNDFDVNKVIGAAGDSLKLAAEVANFDEYVFTSTQIIRSMTPDEFSEWIYDILYENSCKETYDIPSPLGGYIAQGAFDAGDIRDALEEEVDL
jgi:hypothetical protein